MLAILYTTAPKDKFQPYRFPCKFGSPSPWHLLPLKPNPTVPQYIFFSGSNGVCTVHEWKGVLFGQAVVFRMTSVCGHVLTIDFHPKFNNWDRVDPVSVSLPGILKSSTSYLIPFSAGIVFLSNREKRSYSEVTYFVVPWSRSAGLRLLNFVARLRQRRWKYLFRSYRCGKEIS